MDPAQAVGGAGTGGPAQRLERRAGLPQRRQGRCSAISKPERGAGKPAPSFAFTALREGFRPSAAFSACFLPPAARGASRGPGMDRGTGMRAAGGCLWRNGRFFHPFRREGLTAGDAGGMIQGKAPFPHGPSRRTGETGNGKGRENRCPC